MLELLQIGIVSFSSAGIVTLQQIWYCYILQLVIHNLRHADGRWNVTKMVSGAQMAFCYTFAGIGITAGIVNDPTLYLARGRVYEFVMQQGWNTSIPYSKHIRNRRNTISTWSFPRCNLWCNIR